MEAKNYLIVGGSSGIGLEIVNELNQNGHNIYVASRTNDAIANMSRVHHFPLDVRASDASLNGIPDLLHGLVYCPGTIRLKPFQRLTIDDFQEDLQVNYLGAVQVIQACLKKLKKSSSGASILMFSTVAVKTGMPFHTSVAEFAPRIRVNAIAPSLTDTRLAENLLSSEERRRGSAERHPLKRIGTPQDIARLAAHLLSDKGSWITGQIFHVDGGMSSVRIFE